MVHTDHDLRRGGGDFDLKQLLEPGAAGHDGGFFDLGLDPLKPQHHVARHWRCGVDGRGNQTHHRTKAKEQQQGGQIGKGRHRLHHVQQRLHKGLHPRHLVGQNAYRPAHDQRHGHRYSHQRQRIHAFGPIARGQHKAEPQEPKRSHRQPAQVPPQRGDNSNQDRPGCFAQHKIGPVHRIGHKVGKQPHHRFDAVQKPVQKRPDPLGCGQFPRGGPFDQPRGHTFQRQAHRTNDHRDQRRLRACGQARLLRGDVRHGRHASSTCNAAARSDG